MTNFKGQTKRPNKTKSDRGITLVALIITIIILIILVAVTINSLTHDDLAEMAIKGAESYDKAQKDEMNMLNEIDAMVKETVKNLEDGTTKPDEPDKPILAPAPEDRDEPFNPNIDTAYGGLEVIYTPALNQVYNTEGKKRTEESESNEYSGRSFQYFKTSDLPSGWQVWGTDDSYIYIISTNPTLKNLTLQGYTGYNNGVTLLDNICDNVYTDKTTYPGSAGQNLKLEQVLAVTRSIEPDDKENYNKNLYSYEFEYPMIWAEHEELQNESQINRSKAYSYILPSNGIITKTTKSPYSTLWQNNSISSTSYWKTGYNNVSYQAISLNATRYWLSSRYVWTPESRVCTFGLLTTGSYGISYYNRPFYEFREGNSRTSYISAAVRPVVSFPLSLYTLDTSSTPVKIVRKSDNRTELMKKKKVKEKKQ